MTDSEKLFSIVIPAYNYGNTLERALKSVLKQKGSDYEVLVINDGSTDNTEAVLQELHGIYPNRFCSVSRANSGLAATRNYGISNTDCKWLIFLDSDDELEPEALINLRYALAQYPDARMVVGGHMSIESGGGERYRETSAGKCAAMSKEELFTGYLFKKAVTPSNGATAMHRSIFEKIRYPEHFRNSEDIPVFAYVFANFPCAFIDKPINRIYKHSDSLRHNISYANAVGVQLVDAVFDKNSIPAPLQKYKQQFAAQRCLSLFRTFYLAGNRERALYYYREAIGAYWPSVFNLSYTKKALRCLIGK